MDFELISLDFEFGRNVEVVEVVVIVNGLIDDNCLFILGSNGGLLL